MSVAALRTNPLRDVVLHESGAIVTFQPQIRVRSLSGSMNLTFAKGRPVALVPRGLPLATTSPAAVAGSFCASGVRLTLRDPG